MITWLTTMSLLFFYSDGFSTRRTGEEARYTCRLCGKVFNRAGHQSPSFLLVIILKN